jgi:N-acetylneuraminic acid mutarotase
MNDLHAYDPAAEIWTDLSVPISGTKPTARFGHGFTSAGGKLYVFGGSQWYTGDSDSTAKRPTKPSLKWSRL